MSSQKGQKDRDLLIVSNRLPVSIKRSENGGFQTSLSSGGLVSSLSGLSKTTKFRWFGWPGIEVEESEKDSVSESLKSDDAYPIFISDELADSHYNGFSSQDQQSSH
jgi:trehalose 6-phosphate synthase